MENRSPFKLLASRGSDSINVKHHIVKYNWIDGADTLENYKPGGYHPVLIGDVLHNRYRIVDKLGFGGYSTVWLAHDTHQEEYVAVKIGIADSPSISQELKCLRALSASSKPAHPGHEAIPTPLDEFELCGPNGVHPCYTMVPTRCDLREVSFGHLFPLEVARALVGGLTRAISYMHSCGYVHGDIHLRNILLQLPPSLNHLSIKQFYEKYGDPDAVPITLRDGTAGPLSPNVPPTAVTPLYLGIDAEDFQLHDARLLLSDFGESYAPDAPPETRFGPHAPLSYSADIWCLGVAIWEILGMKALFSNEYVTEDEMVSQHIDVLGPMPACWWERWEGRGKFFEPDGRPIEGREVWPELGQSFEYSIQHYRRKWQIGVFGEEETRAILDLVRRMLVFEPDERLTIEEVLKSGWMVRWVISEGGQ
ncbi:kinase-like protein [Aspergillus campestris IBT 28561]|uniref:non-specific serine/threonine protein kinase n=1 Tax=Aspergillus campestris (strain IBT 28561) TaxID=1392248 RepID=A0A2I1CVG0_ASPC2|nr:kinase-like protein [Aspergillus campestris IBT 28561]PKY01613.1 kinase-like protein [Aspergillus campestris IBT 28561]